MKDEIFPINFFSKELNESVIIIERYHEYAWKYADALKVIDYLSKNEYAILGGNVYIVHNSNIAYDGSGWYLNRDGFNSYEEYMKACKNKAIDYITKLYELYGDTIIFTIDFSNNFEC